MPVKGGDEWRRKLKELRRTAPAIVDTGLYALGMRIAGASIIFTPIRYGFLRRATYCTPPADHVVKVGNGMLYARRLHFGSESWNWTEPGTGPMFLQKAWDGEIARAKEFLVRWCDEWLARYGGARVPPMPPATVPTSPPDLNAEARAFYARARAKLRGA